MRRPALVVALLALGVGAWVSQALAIPFGLTSTVGSVLADWHKAGLSCGEPTVGMPGPMVDWFCNVEYEGVTLHARLEADAQGVFGIHAGVPAGTGGAKTSGAYIGLIRATSLLSAAEAEMEGWLKSTNAADSVMPVTATTGILRAVVFRDSEGDPVLFVVPLGSSMLLAE
jgi:hypothetical protein